MAAERQPRGSLQQGLSTSLLALIAARLQIRRQKAHPQVMGKRARLNSYTQMADARQLLDSLPANSNLFASSLLALKKIPHQIPRQKPLPKVVGKPQDSLQGNNNLFPSSLLALKTIPHQIPRQKPLPQGHRPPAVMGKTARLNRCKQS